MTDAGTPQPAGDAMPLTDAQVARAHAALDAWYTNPGGSDSRAPGVTWSADESQGMHAALEASDVDVALLAFGAEPGTWLTTPEQDAENRALMTQIRHQLGLDADRNGAGRSAVTGQEDVAALVAMSNPLPPSAAVSTRVERVLDAYHSVRAGERPADGPEL